MATLIERLAHITPALPIDLRQVTCCWRADPRDQAGDKPYWPAQHGGRCSGLTSGGAAFVVASRSKQLLEVVVGARQISDIVAVEEPGPIASCHLVEVTDRGRERSGFGGVAVHGADQAIKAAAHDRSPCPVRVAEKARGGMDPAVGTDDVGPKRRRVREPARNQLCEAPEPWRERTAPFFASRLRLLSTFSSRPLSFSPEAASGARPSSVIAERTAAA